MGENFRMTTMSLYRAFQKKIIKKCKSAFLEFDVYIQSVYFKLRSLSVFPTLYKSELFFSNGTTLEYCLLIWSQLNDKYEAHNVVL